MLGKRLRVKLLLLLALLASTAGVGMDRASARCDRGTCKVIMSSGVVTGYGCVVEATSTAFCRATVQGCTYTPC